MTTSDGVRLVLIFSLLIYTVCDQTKDKINYIPSLWPQPTFLQFSGYLDGITDNYQLYYWLVKAEKSWETAPLILWLNGGPGCSSLQGVFGEIGPYSVINESRLIFNPYSWNKFANILYFESPVGVGFSFAKDGNVTADDDLTAQNNFHALKNFLNKFPEFKKRDFYITGESYGGVYVPTLALLVIDSLDVNFKGIAIGNGLTNYKLNFNSLLYFFHGHGIMEERSWEFLETQCCDNKTKYQCMFTESNSSKCRDLAYNLIDDMYAGLNPYNIYSECKNTLSTISYTHGDLGNLFLDSVHEESRQHTVSKHHNQNDHPFSIPCIDSTNIRNYLNLKYVQEFIHANLDLPYNWDVCSVTVMENYKRIYRDLTDLYKKLLSSKISILIYNGDIDSVCNHIGDEWFVDNLNLEAINKKEPWRYQDENGHEHVGGYWKFFKHNDTELIFTTIRGAGHMVPEDKPLAALHMIQRFINSQPF